MRDEGEKDVEDGMEEEPGAWGPPGSGKYRERMRAELMAECVGPRTEGSQGQQCIAPGSKNVSPKPNSAELPSSCAAPKPNFPEPNCHAEAELHRAEVEWRRTEV